MSTGHLPEVALEKLVTGSLFVADTPTARANRLLIEAHFRAEWASDIDGTMRTIHPDGPWQRIPGLGVDVVGFDAVREYYLQRFESWPGPAMSHWERAAITDHASYVEGTLRVEPQGGFGGKPAAGKTIECATVIVADFKDGLILGETVYLDTAKVLAQTT